MKALKFNLVLICFVALFMSISFADYGAESEGYCDWGVPIHAKTADTAYYCTTGVVAVDTATWADTLFGQVGWPTHCVDAYLDSVFGCSRVVFAIPVRVDSTLSAGANVWLRDTLYFDAGTYVVQDGNKLQIKSVNRVDLVAVNDTFNFILDGSEKVQITDGLVDFDGGTDLKIDAGGSFYLINSIEDDTFECVVEAESVLFKSENIFGFNNDAFVDGDLMVSGITTFDDASVWMLDDTTFWTDGTVASPGADTSGCVQTGSKWRFFSDNDIAYEPQVRFEHNLFGDTDNKHLYWDGWRWHLDYDEDDSLSCLIFSETDTLKWDSILEAATLTCPLTVEGTQTITNSTALADTALYIKHYGSRTTDYGIVVDLDTSENTAADVIGIDMSGSNAFNNGDDRYLNLSSICYLNGNTNWYAAGYNFNSGGDGYFQQQSNNNIILNWKKTRKGDAIFRDGNLGVVNADFFQIEDSAATDQFTISNEGKITLLDTVTYDLIAYEINAVDSLFIPQWAAAPGTGSSGLFGADTTNDSIIAFLGGTRAVIYPSAGGGGIAETLGVIETDDTTFMTADNDTFRIKTEAMVKWEVDDVAYEKWFASEFKQVSFGYDGKATADYGSVWGGRGGYCSASYGTVVGGYLDSVKANWGFVAGGQNNKILTGTYSGIVSGQNNTVESGTHNCIAGGVNNKLDGGGGFIGGGTQNKIGNLSLYGGIVGGGLDSIGHGSINCFIGSGKNNYISKGGDYNSICGGGYNLIGDGSTDNYNFIGGGYYDTLFADYSGIISGRKNSIQSNCRHSFIGAGYANKIRGDVGDSCNASFGLGSVVDTCLASFAMNCAIKKADSTFGVSKQIWVIDGTDTLKLAKDVSVPGYLTVSGITTFDDASAWMLDDTLFFTDGTAASPGVDTSGCVQDGTYFKFFTDNEFAFEGDVRITAGSFYSDLDVSQIFWRGWRWALDYDGDDSLSLIILGATDTLKWDSIPEAVTLTCPLTVEKITSSGITAFPYVDLDIDDTEEYELTVADGKAGWGMASIDVEWTFFRFTAAGVVTLVNNTTNVSTTDGTDNNFNIFDSGTTITFENQLGDNMELNINVWFTP